MPKSKREFAGITTIILGTILSVYGGYGLGKRVDWCSDYLTGKIDATYRYFAGDTDTTYYEESPCSLEELKEQSEYIKRNSIITVIGLGLVGFGIIVAGTRLSPPGISKPTDYGKSFSEHKKGTREHPYRL